MTNKVRAVCLRVVALLFLIAAVVMLTAVAREVEARGGPPLLTLREKIEIALECNLDMQVAREEIPAARERQKEAETAFLPSLSGKYSYRVSVRSPMLSLRAEKSMLLTRTSTVSPAPSNSPCLPDLPSCPITR